MLAAERKQRRDGFKLLALGILFFSVGVLLCVVGNPWMGAIGICFGIMGVAIGAAEIMGGTSLVARMLMIVGCAAFAVTGAIALLAGILAPEAWGWRGGVAGIVAGALGLGFFGPGTAILIYKEYRLRRQR